MGAWVVINAGWYYSSSDEPSSTQENPTEKLTQKLDHFHHVTSLKSVLRRIETGSVKRRVGARVIVNKALVAAYQAASSDRKPLRIRQSIHVQFRSPDGAANQSQPFRR